MRWLKRKPQPAAASAEAATWPQVLHTAQLCLRPLSPDDAADLHRLWIQPGVRRFLWDDRVLSLEQTLDTASHSADLFEQGGFGLWVARDERGVLCGFCGYWRYRSEHELELMYGVDESHWLRRYGREMAEAMVAYGFEHLRLQEIRASTHAPNLASQRVLKRLGFLADTPRAGGSGKLFFRLPRTRRNTDAEGWEAA